MTNDEGTIGGDGASNAGPQHTPEDDVHILEEHVVSSAPPKPAVTPPAPSETSSTPELLRKIPPTPSAPVPTPAPVQTDTNTPQTEAQSAIAAVLKKIQLPERKKEVTAPKKSFDTTLADPQKQPEKIAAQSEAIETARTITETLQKKDSTSAVQALHTLKDDLQHVVRDKKISLVRAVALEEEKRHHGTGGAKELSIEAHKESRTRFGLFFGGILLLVGALALGTVFYVMQDRASESPPLVNDSILFAEQMAPLPIDSLSPADIRREVAGARQSPLTLGAILQIVPVTGTGADARPVAFGTFLEKIGARAPEELSRALTDEFFLGMHTVDENAPLIVIPVKSYERAFAAMLEWEKTMNQDLSPIFTLVSPQAVSPGGLPTARTFEDTVMRNYDVRIVKDDAGTIQLYYSFPTRNILIIAESQYSFTEILSRLRADRRL